MMNYSPAARLGLNVTSASRAPWLRLDGRQTTLGRTANGLVLGKDVATSWWSPLVKQFHINGRLPPLHDYRKTLPKNTFKYIKNDFVWGLLGQEPVESSSENIKVMENT
ncbi:hypothetical protein RRG08_055238 [Elysia crispata]|uniref:Uncharacterized protein n=1 Tax=Elysia crispata TaxID=231223 RepID=A0AAE0XVJ0_9GAST|nr:hypothetical protein RRG08_055238 [Elysia crispata]